ncbi:DUF3383 family protein [Lentilactobacillus buchneri]|uniref:DUF3383 family protein n=1 Tax=Lentilactobacillus buchneri TaxID=1581 RepID=UPI0021A528EA|nr:DUF3383 family protein [Lentilactobacillus buchneri]MCT2881920.1 hypothetical protein [Lentilactobacillus buchneri]
MALIPKITDVYVTLDITHPQTTVGLKNPAIFVKGDSESYKEYQTLDALEADYDATTSVYRKAQTAFDQADYPELVAVITFTGDSPAPVPTTAPAPTNLKATPTDDGAVITADKVDDSNGGDPDAIPASGAGKAAADYFYNNWEFAMLADYNKADALALADIIKHGGYDGKGFHIFFQQFDADNADDAAKFNGYSRTFCFYHTDSSEDYAAALAAQGANQAPIGQVSWKFVGDLVDVTPEALTASQIIALEKKGFILYVHKGNNNNQTDDKNVAGMYVDTVHGMDFVKSNVETNLQNTLNTAGKVPFDAQGLGMISASLEGSLSTAYNQEIVATDLNTGKPMYSTSVPAINQIHITDWVKRDLKGVKFTYTPSSAVNEIHVTGDVAEAF